MGVDSEEAKREHGEPLIQCSVVALRCRLQIGALVAEGPVAGELGRKTS